MRNFYYLLTDLDFNDLEANIPDKITYRDAQKICKKWMRKNNIEDAIISKNSMEDDNILEQKELHINLELDRKPITTKCALLEYLIFLFSEDKIYDALVDLSISGKANILKKDYTNFDLEQIKKILDKAGLIYEIEPINGGVTITFDIEQLSDYADADALKVNY